MPMQHFLASGICSREIWALRSLLCLQYDHIERSDPIKQVSAIRLTSKFVTDAVFPCLHRKWLTSSGVQDQA